MRDQIFIYDSLNENNYHIMFKEVFREKLPYFSNLRIPSFQFDVSQRGAIFQQSLNFQ